MKTEIEANLQQQMDNLKRENASLLRRNKQLGEKCQQDQKSAYKEKKEMEHIQQLTKEHDMMKKELVATQQHQQEEMRRLTSSHKQKVEDMTKAEVQKKQLYEEMK